MVTMAEILQSAKTTPNIAQTKDVSFYDPQGEREAKRKRALSELLVKQGNTPMKNETAGGMTVARSPWENMNQAAQKYMGEYQLAQADEREAGLEQRRQQAMQEALSQWGTDPQAAAAILGQDPRTSEMAAKILQGEVDYGRQQDRWAQEDALRREQIGVLAQRAASGGNTPAAMQIANKMFALEQAMFDPNASEQERFMAQREYNLLGQAAKTYGFDRGLEVGGMGGYGNMGGGMQGVMSPQSGVSPQDPMPQDDFGSLAPEPSFMPQPLGVQTMRGYGEAVADIAAQKKAAETTAASDAKYMAEGRQALPKIQRSLQDSERSNQNIMRVSNQVRGDADKAFTTGFTGSIASAVPGTAAYDLRQNLNTLRSNAAFDTLQNMRNNSPTGGALGAISERELELLESAFTNLNNSQTKEQFLQNLDAFERQNQASLEAMRSAYEQDYQRFGGQRDPYLPQPTAQPQIAVNPQTGEQLINRGNGWESYNGQ